MATAPTPSAPVLTCRGLSLQAGGRTLVADLDLTVDGGQRVCVLGRNGAGKTTLLHTLAGLARPADGTVAIDGRDVAGEPRARLARQRGLVMQITEDPFPATVREMAMIGRHPHLSFWEWEGADDHRLTLAALGEVGLADLADRPIDTLSGGERRRLAIATALCQDPRIYLLDEPLNHLDPQHQLEVIDLFTARARRGATVLASLHDINMAARFADRALLLFGPEENGRWLYGPADRVLAEDHLSSLYRAPIRQLRAGERRLFVTG